MVSAKQCIVMVMAAGALLLAGCASDTAMEIQQRVTSWEALAKKPADATYIVDPPDTIRIEFLNDASLTRVEPLRQDGMVTLPYLEDVNVGGLTTIQIREKLENLYSKYYKEPRILVSVAAFNSKHIYVYGEVSGVQGIVPYTGAMTVSDAIGRAGGVTQRAAWWRVRVIRGDPDHPEVSEVNLRSIILEGDLRQEVSLAENDVVRVPPTWIAWIGYEIDNLLFPFRGILGAATSYETLRNLR